MTIRENGGPLWTIEAIDKLKQLWNEGVSLELISQTLQRPEEVVLAKAAELKLPRHPGA